MVLDKIAIWIIQFNGNVSDKIIPWLVLNRNKSKIMYEKLNISFIHKYLTKKKSCEGYYSEEINSIKNWVKMYRE